MLFLKIKGNSLIWVLLLTFLTGVAIAFILNVLDNFEKNIQTQETSFLINETVEQVKSILSSKLACKNTFLGIKAKNPTATGTANYVNRIVQDDNTVQFQANTKLEIPSLKITSFYLDDADSDVAVNTGGTGNTKLYIAFDKGEGVYGSQLHYVKIPLWVSVDASDKITECLFQSPDSSSLFQGKFISHPPFQITRSTIGYSSLTVTLSSYPDAKFILLKGLCACAHQNAGSEMGIVINPTLSFSIDPWGLNSLGAIYLCHGSGYISGLTNTLEISRLLKIPEDAHTIRMDLDHGSGTNNCAATAVFDMFLMY